MDINFHGKDRVMNHDIIFVMGRAREWYWDLERDIMVNHSVVPCRQGIALESPHSFIAILPAANTVFEALATVDLPRRGKSEQRVTFSILCALRRILGYHDTVLFDKYPVLEKLHSSAARAILHTVNILHS